MKEQRYALISVYDKTGLEPVARALTKFKISILSSGGTAKAIREWRIPVTDVSDFTGFPEIFGGRVKTMHPKITGGILMRRDNKSDVAEAKVNGILPIDFVITNLYPFREKSQSGIPDQEVIEFIDIGGPTLLRSAAKNWQHVAVVCHPRLYPALIDSLENFKGSTDPFTRFSFARSTFEETAMYDSDISTWFDDAAAPPLD